MGGTELWAEQPSHLCQRRETKPYWRLSPIVLIHMSNHTELKRGTWVKKAGFDSVWNQSIILKQATINRHSLLPWLNTCRLLPCVKFVLSLLLQVNEDSRKYTPCWIKVQCLSVISFSLFPLTKWIHLKYQELDFSFSPYFQHRTPPWTGCIF